MATRAQGQHKSEFDKAKEQLERQDSAVNKLIDRQVQLKRELEQVEDELLVADELLQYYKEHPVLKVSDRRDPSQIREHEGEFDEPELPIESPTWKGFKEKHLQEK